MFFTVYETKNLINNKTYIGTHITDYPNDNYLGSGIIITKAIKKYKSENFQKEILFIFNNPEDMFAKEKELVNKEWITKPDTYNIKLGGEGGWDYVNKNGLNIGVQFILDNNLHKHQNRSSSGLATKKLKVGIFNPKYNEIRSEWSKNSFKNKKHTKETKKQIGLKNSFNQKGEKNSQYGKIWITNGIDNKVILKEKLDFYISLNYHIGRTVIKNKEINTNENS